MAEYRYDTLHDAWVIISPERAGRPQRPPDHLPPGQEESCPFCPGREAETPGSIYVSPPDTPPGQWRLRVFPNKYPAVTPGGGSTQIPRLSEPLAAAAHGYHEVVVETREHHSPLATRPREEILRLLTCYRDRLIEIGADPAIRSVQVFKNSGANAGASIDHPHSQILATPFVPRVLQTELETMARHLEDHGECMLCAVAKRALESGERLVSKNDDFVAFCPFASRASFETMLVPRRHEKDFRNSTAPELMSMASILQDVVRRVTAAFSRQLDGPSAPSPGYRSAPTSSAKESPPYNCLLHTFPYADPGAAACRRPTVPPVISPDLSFHWHIEILTRTEMFGGFEWGTGTCINSMTPERAAEVLREVGSA